MYAESTESDNINKNILSVVFLQLIFIQFQIFHIKKILLTNFKVFLKNLQKYNEYLFSRTVIWNTVYLRSSSNPSAVLTIYFFSHISISSNNSSILDHRSEIQTGETQQSEHCNNKPSRSLWPQLEQNCSELFQSAPNVIFK